MTLLEFARGPALQFSLIILVGGSLWRLLGIVTLPHKADPSEARSDNWLGSGLAMIFTRMLPRRAFWAEARYAVLLAYTFHIGLAVVVFGFGPHILFIKGLSGLSWPALPTGLVNFVAVVTFAALVAMLVRRLTQPVLQLLSNFDDYFSWAITAAPVATGLMAVAHVGARYETILAVHILSVALLLVWLPFGKLAHTFLWVLSRATTGAVFARRGAKT